MWFTFDIRVEGLKDAGFIGIDDDDDWPQPLYLKLIAGWDAQQPQRYVVTWCESCSRDTATVEYHVKYVREWYTYGTLAIDKALLLLRHS